MLDSALSGLRTFILLAVLVVAVALAGTWGWKAMTAPFPQKVDVGPCADTPVKKGDTVYPSQVVVTVLNASTRAGLANRAITDLVDEGFVKGGTGNAPRGTKLRTVEVWAPDKDAPSAALVASWLGDAKIVETKIDRPGIVVITGEKFPEVEGGEKTVTAKADGTICSPPVE
ncbi:MAG: LytR C-terminal domain-containing protein [Nocardioides sp.]|uniref:LytR C-terminal domain-containing protein n=1 Tax=Nocardioides sp. TaxID=35761 RepID=UPI003D6AE562